MTAQTQENAWLDAWVVRTISDIGLGCVLVIAGLLVTRHTGLAPFANLARLSPWFMPAALGGLILAVGAALIARGVLWRTGSLVRWSSAQLLVVVPAVAVLLLVAQPFLGLQLRDLFGPSEYAALFALELAVLIAVMRGSLVRGIGMALLGLLLGTIGTDIESGTARFTLGLVPLQDGLEFTALAFGLIIVADAAVGVISPSLLVATYARHVHGLPTPTMPSLAALGLRLLALLVMLAAIYAAFRVNASMFDVGVMLAAATFGVACKILDWNRFVLLLAFVREPLLEENIRRALLISRGDALALVRWPLSASMLMLAAALLGLAAFLSIRHGLLQRRRPA